MPMWIYHWAFFCCKSSLPLSSLCFYSKPFFREFYALYTSHLVHLEDSLVGKHLDIYFHVCKFLPWQTCVKGLIHTCAYWFVSRDSSSSSIPSSCWIMMSNSLMWETINSIPSFRSHTNSSIDIRPCLWQCF